MRTAFATGVRGPFLKQGLDADQAFGVLTDACIDRVDTVTVGLHLNANLIDIAFDPADADGKQAEPGESGPGQDLHRGRAVAAFKSPRDLRSRVFGDPGLDESVLHIGDRGGHEPILPANWGWGLEIAGATADDRAGVRTKGRCRRWPAPGMPMTPGDYEAGGAWCPASPAIRPSIRPAAALTGSLARCAYRAVV